MNFEFFIAKRIISSQPDKKKKGNALVGTAVVAIALGLSVMIISISILTGFKQEITNKLVGFSSHIQIVNLGQNTSFETEPINRDQDFIPDLKVLEGVNHINPFITKPGIIKSGMEIQGIYLKGIDSTYSWSFFQNHLAQGEIPDYNTDEPTNEIFIGQALA